jgi:putative DNA primase/helicase
MSEAARLAAKLDGVRENGEWRCLCPSHGGHSLFLSDGHGGKLIAKCFGAGCSWNEILAALRKQGLVDHRRREDVDPNYAAELRRLEEERAKSNLERLARRISRARTLYRQSVPAVGTATELYLRSRGIELPIPSSLRFVRHCPNRNGHYYPAMVAPIANLRGELTAVHKTFLRADGTGKADFADKEDERETYGPMQGGAIRLAQHGATLLVGEGIESVFSAMQMFALPGWAAVCAAGIPALQLPADVRHVVIAGDNDVSGTGHRAALHAQELWEGEGRTVQILMPPNVGEDFNDVLRAGRCGG